MCIHFFWQPLYAYTYTHIHTYAEIKKKVRKKGKTDRQEGKKLCLVLLKTHEFTNQNLRVTASSGPKFGKLHYNLVCGFHCFEILNKLNLVACCM